jgi:hypothetical protein
LHGASYFRRLYCRGASTSHQWRGISEMYREVVVVRLLSWAQNTHELRDQHVAPAPRRVSGTGLTFFRTVAACARRGSINRLCSLFILDLGYRTSLRDTCNCPLHAHCPRAGSFVTPRAVAANVARSWIDRTTSTSDPGAPSRASWHISRLWFPAARVKGFGRFDNSSSPGWAAACSGQGSPLRHRAKVIIKVPD